MAALDISINPAGARIGAAQVVVALNSVQRQARQTTDTMGKGFAGLALTMSRVQRILVGIAVGGTFTLLIRGMRTAIDTMANFAEGMAEVRAVTQSTATEFAALEEKARSLGASTRFTATEAAKGMAFLGRAGFETSEILDAIPATLDLASAGMLGLGEAADIVSNVMQGFGLEAERTRESVDVMAQTAASSNTNILQLGQAMKFVAPIARATGVSLEETATVIGALGNAGIQAGLAGTGLRRLLAALANPTRQAREAIANAGLAIEDLDVKGRGLFTVLETLKDANLTTTEAFRIFGLRGATPLLALLDQLGDQFDDLTEKINNAGGVSREMARVMEDTLPGAFRRVQAAASDTAIAMGKGGVESATKDSADAFADLLTSAEDTATFFGFLSGLAIRAVNIGMQSLATITLASTEAWRGFVDIIRAPFSGTEKGIEIVSNAFHRLNNILLSGSARIRRLIGLESELTNEIKLQTEAAKELARTQDIFSREMLAGDIIAPVAAGPTPEERRLRTQDELRVTGRIDKLKEELRLATLMRAAEEQGIATREQAVRAIEKQTLVSETLNKVMGQSGTLTPDQEKEVRRLAAALFEQGEATEAAQARMKAYIETTIAFTSALTDQANAVNLATEELRILEETAGNEQERNAQLKLMQQVEAMRRKGQAATQAQKDALLELNRIEEARLAQADRVVEREGEIARARQSQTDALTNLARELNTLTREEEISRIADPTEREVQLQLLEEQNRARANGINLSDVELAAREKLIRKNEEMRQSIDMNRSQLQEFSESGVTLFEAINEAAVNAFQGMEDAIVEFAKTGRISFTEMIDSMLEDLLRMLVRTQITAPLSGALNNILQGGNVGQNVQQGLGGTGGGGLAGKLLGLVGGFFGGGGGGGAAAAIAGGAVGGTTLSGSFIPDFQTGGIVPGPMGKKRLITAEGGERVLTRDQQKQSPVNVTMNISTPDAPSFQRSQDQILARMQVGLSRASRRNN